LSGFNAARTGLSRKGGEPKNRRKKRESERRQGGAGKKGKEEIISRGANRMTLQSSSEGCTRLWGESLKRPARCTECTVKAERTRRGMPGRDGTLRTAGRARAGIERKKKKVSQRVISSSSKRPYLEHVLIYASPQLPVREEESKRRRPQGAPAAPAGTVQTCQEVKASRRRKGRTPESTGRTRKHLTADGRDCSCRRDLQSTLRRVRKKRRNVSTGPDRREGGREKPALFQRQTWGRTGRMQDRKSRARCREIADAEGRILIAAQSSRRTPLVASSLSPCRSSGKKRKKNTPHKRREGA